ncbi:MAG: hypothetical protein IM638_10425 [Bacteroidetes bacterium]|nr:hypothetical protein [Bacteroidota bacterium]
MDVCNNNPNSRRWCEMMQRNCSDDYNNADTPIYISYKFNEFGLKIMDGGSSYILISHCPFCGTKLPESLRDKWYAEMDKRGIDTWADEIPEAYKTDAWYRNEAE